MKMAGTRKPRGNTVEIEGEEVALKAPNLLVHHMVRGISRSNAFLDGGAVPAYVIDEELSGYLLNGWTLKHTFYLGESPEHYQMLYILVKED